MNSNKRENVSPKTVMSFDERKTSKNRENRVNNNIQNIISYRQCKSPHK